MASGKALQFAQASSDYTPTYVPTGTGVRRIPSRAEGSGYIYKSAYDAATGATPRSPALRQPAPRQQPLPQPAPQGSVAPGFSLHGMTRVPPRTRETPAPVPAANTRTLHRAGDSVKSATASAEPEGRKPQSLATYRDGVYALEKDYYLSYPLNIWRMFTAPARFDAKDWWVAAGLAGATGIFLVLDKEIREFWQNDIRSGTSEDVFDVLNFFGDVKYMGALSLGTYAIAEAVDQAGLANAKREKALGLMALESIALAQGISFSLKWITGRDRPNKTDNRYEFKGPGNGDNQAFPSGHATVAFALATTISEVYGETSPWVPWVTYPIAVGTALARVDKNKHWASDVFVGGLVGYFVAKTVVKYNPFLEKRNITLRPLNSVDGPGMSFVRRF
jgi:membrane-associated phospholipid phosphatase